jgi:hypothetical protein
MKRVVSIAVALAAAILPRSGHAADPFERKLSPDLLIVHALNRLTFGPRPGDVENVRRIGLARWIEQQLHPNQILENPVLEERLAPLETLRMPISEVVAKYSPAQNMGMMIMEPPIMVINSLPQSVRTKVLNGTAEDRTAALDAMDPDLRAKVLAALPENVAAYTPKLLAVIRKRSFLDIGRERLAGLVQLEADAVRFRAAAGIGYLHA